MERVSMTITLVTYKNALRNELASYVPRFIPNLPIEGVCSENGEVNALIHGHLESIAHLHTPILTMANNEQPMIVLQRVGGILQIGIREITDIIAVLFKPAHHRIFIPEK